MMRLSATFTRRAAASSGSIVAEGADADDIGIGIGRFGKGLFSVATDGFITGAAFATGVATASSSQFNMMCSPNSF
jgi:hypothetical protein